MSITVSQTKKEFAPVTLVISSEDDLELLINNLDALKFVKSTDHNGYFDVDSIMGQSRRAQVIELVRQLLYCGGLE